MDKSFEGLLFSVMLHLLLVVAWFHLPAPPPGLTGSPTEITLIDPSEAPVRIHKRKPVIDELEQRQVDDNVKDTADFLSKFTKRVKKQLIARQLGPARNSEPTPIPLNPKDTAAPGRAAGENMKPGARSERGIGFSPPGGNQALREMAIGPSSTPFVVPGLETAEFTSLNTDQFTYYAFFQRMQEQVYNRWVASLRNYVDSRSLPERERLASTDWQTVVEILLTPTGEFSYSVLEHASGDQTLDQIAINAFREAAPFINPPKGMVENDGLIHLRQGFIVRGRPPFGQAVN